MCGNSFCGGKVDMVMMRIVDIIYSLPDMLLIILLAVVLNEVLTPVIKGIMSMVVLIILDNIISVSYTHLDVYKRQGIYGFGQGAQDKTH